MSKLKSIEVGWVFIEISLMDIIVKKTREYEDDIYQKAVFPSQRSYIPISLRMVGIGQPSQQPKYFYG